MTIPAITIDIDKALELLEAAVADRGADYQYPSADAEDGCTYFATEPDVQHDLFPEVGAPACIVGWALDSLGVTVTDLGDDNVNTGANTLFTHIRLDHPEFTVTEHARRLLNGAQSDQDRGMTYGSVLENARRTAARYKAFGHR